MLNMFRKIKAVFSRFRQYKQRGKVHSDLDVLLTAAQEQVLLEEKLQWLVRLLAWIRYEVKDESAATRLRYLLMVLDRNPAWKKSVAKILRNVVKQVSGIELYTETGLPREMGMWGEAWDRFMLKLLPEMPLDRDLATLFLALFPDDNDFDWIMAIDAETFEKIVELFSFEVDTEEQDWNRLFIDMEDALMYLVIQTRAIGLAPSIRVRLDKPHFRDSAFYSLVRGMEEFFTAYHSGNRADFFEKASRFRLLVWECRRELAQVYSHLDVHGVSVSIVFQVERIRAYLERIDNLVEIVVSEKLDYKKVSHFLSDLVYENQKIKSISSLFSQNIAMLARKVAERAAETGEHYITRTRDQYRKMFAAAAGGGALTAITVYIKFWILTLGLSRFFEGVFASLNYSLSFVAIHVAGFTLATKQPAMTAPALAAKMHDVDSDAGMDSLVDEITHLIRSQMASVVGNVLFVVPVALLINLIYYAIFGTNAMSPEKAQYAMHSVDIFGPTLIYAAFTGILLWSSSIVAGWADNWFAFYSLRKSLSRSPSLRAVFGKIGARKIAVYLENNISGLAGNIALGIMLGMVPEIMNFIGLHLDVRHVTLSSGTLGAALPVLGVGVFSLPEFWRAVAGLAFIGMLNVGVSFAMALWVAVKARGVNTPQRRAIRLAVFSRLRKHPLTFFFPVGEAVKKNSSQPGTGH
ncbi:Site-specific recombinase [compost metagenome]